MWWDRAERRFIPARAGNGASIQFPNLGVPVHPRACGERLLCLALLVGFGGSSPRMRGTVRLHGVREPIWRFIPAHAGNGSS